MTKFEKCQKTKNLTDLYFDSLEFILKFSASSAEKTKKELEKQGYKVITRKKNDMYTLFVFNN
jgi:hypothetical protein